MIIINILIRLLFLLLQNVIIINVLIYVIIVLMYAIIITIINVIIYSNGLIYFMIIIIVLIHVWPDFAFILYKKVKTIFIYTCLDIFIKILIQSSFYFTHLHGFITWNVIFSGYPVFK